MPSTVEQLNQAHAAKIKVIEEIKAQASELVAKGKYQEAQEVVSKGMKTLFQGPTIEQILINETSIPPAAIKGISSGRMAAYVAGVGAVGLASVWAYNKWADRAQERPETAHAR